MSSKNTKDKSSEKDWFDSRVEVIGLTPERNKQIKCQTDHKELYLFRSWLIINLKQPIYNMAFTHINFLIFMNSQVN